METTTPSSERTPPDFDMVDTDADTPACEPLRFALTTFRDNVLCTGKAVVGAYHEADSDALRNQKFHQILSTLAAVFGTTAVLFAIVQLSGFTPAHWPMWVEVLAAGIALLAIVLGYAQARQHQWLFQRHKAERYRLLKFRFLISHHLWRGEKERWLEELNEAAGKIEKLSRRTLHEWLSTTGLPSRPPDPAKFQFTPETLRALANYYLKKRLEVQRRYFDMQANRNEDFNRYTRRLPPLFFFCSSVAVLGHFLIDIASGKGHELHGVSVLLIVLAAAFPVLGAGVRTLRSAHEFARNTLRYRAQCNMLTERGQALAAEIAKEQPVAREIFHDLWCCEELMEFEHREWLSLMTEAEWFL